MSLSLRALATSTSWPHSSSTLIAHGEWVPASIAMRMGCSVGGEAPPEGLGVGSQPTLLDHLAAVLIDEAQVGVFVAEVQSCRRPWSLFVTIHLGPILLSILGVRVP